ncbi:MAG: hypothetical protein GY851_08040 [bacterium]|nr:hypothetical protein [bacterium]
MTDKDKTGPWLQRMLLEGGAVAKFIRGVSVICTASALISCCFLYFATTYDWPDISPRSPMFGYGTFGLCFGLIIVGTAGVVCLACRAVKLRNWRAVPALAVGMALNLSSLVALVLSGRQPVV